MAWSPGPSRYPEVESEYELFETLGSGGFAKVKLGIHKLTGEKVAVKIMNKAQLGDDLHRVYREMRALQKLHHQHICQLFQIIETDRMIYLIIEYCPGGELFDYIVARERLKENEARAFFRQIVSALMYVHNSGFIHRDLKPENLLLDEDSNIKLIDFGLVSEPKSIHQLLKTCCGSPAYAAPELITGGPYIGPNADVWSLGVLLYALLNGFLPFDDDNTATLYGLIKKGEYEIPRWLSVDSIEILSHLLQTLPSRRVSVNELLNHHWAMKGYRKSIDWESKIDLQLLDVDCVSELAKYHGLSELSMSQKIKEWKYDEVTATYFLLLQQKNSGKTPHIKLPPKSIVTRRTGRIGSGVIMSPPPNQSPLVHRFSSIDDKTVNNSQEQNTSDDESDEDEYPEDEESATTSNTSSSLSPVAAVRSRKISLGQPMHPPTIEIKSLQRPTVPPTPQHRAVQKVIKQESPVLTKPFFPPSSPLALHTGTVPVSPSFDFRDRQALTLPPQSTIVKTASFDSRLNKLVDLPDETLSTNLQHPSPGRKKRFGSVDLAVTKLRKLFNRKPISSDIGPKKVKGLFDTSTTSTLSESEVMHRIETTLDTLEIQYTKTNLYKYRCRKDVMERRGSKKDVEFSLEICAIADLNIIGIKRKRIRGDLWQYKQICEEIFSNTHL